MTTDRKGRIVGELLAGRIDVVSEATNEQRWTRLRRFKPYPAYKNSGVEWLGEIPAHWEVKALKRLGGLQAGAGFPDDEQGVTTEDIPFFKVGDMGSTGNEREMLEWQHTVSEPTARRLRAFLFPPGTIVFAKVGAALMLNRRRLLTRPSCMDNNMMGFMPGDCDPTWAMHWLSGLDMGELANPGAVPSVNEGQMRDTPAIVPPEPEQRAIAAFLDRETARIDALVAKKERLIKLLQEKRTALITRAVTKGLDPNVPMKDSGVEWLGDIPAHWQAKRIKHMSSVENSGAYGVETGEGAVDLPVCTTAHVTPDGRLLFDDMPLRGFSTAEEGRYVGRPGDLFVVKSSGSNTNIISGKLALVGADTPKIVFSNFLMRIRPSTKVVRPRFLAFLLRSELTRERIQRMVATTTYPNIDVPEYVGSVLAIPPVAEQDRITAVLDQETARIDTLVAKVRDAIDGVPVAQQTHDLSSAPLSSPPR